MCFCIMAREALCNRGGPGRQPKKIRGGATSLRALLSGSLLTKVVLA